MFKNNFGESDVSVIYCLCKKSFFAFLYFLCQYNRTVQKKEILVFFSFLIAVFQNGFNVCLDIKMCAKRKKDKIQRTVGKNDCDWYKKKCAVDSGVKCNCRLLYVCIFY